MNYDLNQTVRGQIPDEYRHSMPYGAMPPAMLMSKFDETNVDEDPEQYSNYFRGLASNFGPDTPAFEHEGARGGVNRSAGMLQLRHNGHRGDADTPYRPEHFDGFQGAEYRDPRGTNVDPDMKKLVEQSQARARFHLFNPDGNASITGGGINEDQMMAVKQKVFRRTREQLKIFDRQIDGRREGLRRTFKHKSDVNKQINVKSYGDAITDYALNPQRRANIIAKEVIRDSQAYRAETADCDRATAYYSQSCRTRTQKTADSLAHDTEAEADFAAADVTAAYKSVGILMSNVIKAKANTMQRGDIDMANSTATVSAKTAPITKDITAIMKNIVTSTDFAAADATQGRKNAARVMADHLARVTVTDAQSAQAHGEMSYKSVKPSADTRALASAIIADSKDPHIRDQVAATMKSARMERATGRKLATAEDQDVTSSRKTATYSSAARVNGDKRIRLTSGDGRKYSSDESLVRRPNKTQHRAVTAGDTEEMIGYDDNNYANRHGGRIGSKYIRDREGFDSGGLSETGLITSQS